MLLFLVLVFSLNVTHQNIIKYLNAENEQLTLQNQKLFASIKIIYLIANSLLILNIITIVAINIFIKNRGGIW
ncbi:Uncharacterised protein, partial [Metamycoplasma alkalescens]